MSTRNWHRAMAGLNPYAFTKSVVAMQWGAIGVNAVLVPLQGWVLLSWPTWWVLPNAVAGAFCCYCRGFTAGYWRRPRFGWLNP